MADQITTDWIAVDWGTSNLRAWAMQGPRPLTQAQSSDGMSNLPREGFEQALNALLEAWDIRPGTPILACGMVGSRQGWTEAPYRPVPCTPMGDQLIQVGGTDLNVHIIPGLRQTTPADVMRGEETQIAGFLALNDGWDGVICLPGTHTKWAQISAGEVVSFQTFMTGELFALTAEASVLRYSVGSDAWDENAFDSAVSDTLSKPEKLAARLFSIRADDLLNGTPPASLRARLSGLLIGAELAAARPYWLGTNIALIGATTQAQIYARALQSQGAPALIADAERMTLSGLTTAYRKLIAKECV